MDENLASKQGKKWKDPSRSSDPPTAKGAAAEQLQQQQSYTRKARIVWDKKIHGKFIKAFNQLGIENFVLAMLWCDAYCSDKHGSAPLTRSFLLSCNCLQLWKP